MGLQIESAPHRLGLQPTDLLLWRVIDEQEVPSEVTGAAARFRIFTYESFNSNKRHLLKSGHLHGEISEAQEMQSRITIKSEEIGFARASESKLLAERLKLLRLYDEYTEMESRREHILTNELVSLSLRRGDPSYAQELEHLNYLIAQTEEYARSTINDKAGEIRIEMLEQELKNMQAQFEAWQSEQGDDDRGAKFEQDRAKSFREMAFGEWDLIVKSDFVQQGSKKFSWKRAVDFLLNQGVNVFGSLEPNERRSIDADMGSVILDYLSTRLIERGAYQTLINSREQISNFIQQFEISDQAKVRAGLVKNYLIDQYNFIVKMGTGSVDIDPHSDLITEDLVSKSEAGLDIYDMVWHHWTQLFTLKYSKDPLKKNSAVHNILNSPLINQKLGILRPRSIDPNGYSTYQHATLFLLAARGLNQSMADVIRPWVISEPLSRKKMGGVIAAMAATVARNPGIDSRFGDDEWVATPPSGSVYDSDPSFSAEVVAYVINNGIMLTPDRMTRLIEWTLPERAERWQAPQPVKTSDLYVSREKRNRYGLQMEEKDKVKSERWTGRLVHAFLTLINQLV